MEGSIKHLVLSGGELKGIAFLGAIECLLRKKAINMDNIITFAGSSVGAIISSLLAIGYTIGELFRVVVDLDVASLSDIDLSKLITHFGLCSGHMFITKLKELYVKKGFDADITFKALHAKTNKRLIVTVSCLGKGVKYFDHMSEPDLSVISAVRMSFSLPLLFTAVKYRGDYYVDGGLLDNVPMKSLASEPSHTVVVIRCSAPDMDISGLPSAEDFVWLLMNTILREMDRLRIQSAKHLHNFSTIVIPTNELKRQSHIHLTLADKQNMFKAGYRAALTYLTSDAWLTQRVHNLPYNVMRQVWKEVHRPKYKDVMEELAKGIAFAG